VDLFVIGVYKYRLLVSFMFDWQNIILYSYRQSILIKHTTSEILTLRRIVLRDSVVIKAKITQTGNLCH
jgi:hypothetical protein